MATTTCRVHRSKALSVDLWCRRQCSVSLEYYAEDAYQPFRPTEERRWVQAPRRYECMAINWLEWEAKNTGQHIRHQGNDSEKLIGMKRLPVDGFCRDTNTVYEFQGCIWHGHRCWMTKKHNGVNPVNGKNLDDLYQHTQDKIQYIKEQGYNVVEMWECQRLASIKRDPELSRFIEHRKRPCDGLVTMTEDQILTAVMDEKLFGALEVDLHVPDKLRSKFADL